MSKLAHIIAALTCLSLVSCNDADIRERKFTEVTCFGLLEKENGKYKCLSDGSVEPIDISKSEKTRVVTINRRTGSVAFDKQIVGDCKVADFDLVGVCRTCPGSRSAWPL